MIIIRDNDYNIFQDDRYETLYTIFFNHSNEALIKSITHTKLLLGTTVTDNYKTMIFKATTVQTFKTYQEQLLQINKTSAIKYECALKLVLYLVTQLKYLIKNHKKTFLGYNPEKIIVIDDSKFLYLSSEYLLDINIDSEYKLYKQENSIDNQLITITYPFSQNDFFQSPELELVKEIPSRVHYKTSYYSLGCLLIYALVGDKKYIEENDEYESSTSSTIPERKTLLKSLDFIPIKGTKLYNLIKRCLEDDPNKRTILFI